MTKDRRRAKKTYYDGDDYYSTGACVSAEDTEGRGKRPVVHLETRERLVRAGRCHVTRRKETDEDDDDRRVRSPLQDAAARGCWRAESNRPRW